MKKMEIKKKQKTGFYKNRRELPIKFKEGPGWPADLDWTDKEARDIALRIMKLRDDQIAAFTWLVGVGFYKADLINAVSEIKEEGLDGGDLPAVIYEADSKENLLWWLEFFENANKK